MLKSIIKKVAWKKGKWRNLYVRFCQPNGYEYAEYLKLWGRFYSIGDRCSIRPSCNITDPALTRIGNNVQLGENCHIFCHDGSIACLNIAFNKSLDRIGKVDILDNVYVGNSAMVLPNVTIGPNALVGAGAVVTKTVPPDTIVAGNPARVVGKVSELVERLERNTEQYPWYELIVKRGTAGFDPAIEPELERMRVEHFFKDQ